MKLTFYVDIWNHRHQQQHGFITSTVPSGAKIVGAKRWAFDVVIPDDILDEVGARASEVTRPRIVGTGE